MKRLMMKTSTVAAAAALTCLTIAHGGHDNASAVVVDVLALPPANLRDSLEGAASLPLPPRLRPGLELDGLLVTYAHHAQHRVIVA